MRSSIKICNLRIIFLSLSLINAGYCQTNTKFNTDQFLRTANLQKLINDDQTFNLLAQLNDPNVRTSDVNDMNEFIAIGPLDYGTIITRFDRDQVIKEQIKLDVPWTGVRLFKQSEIPTLTLQQGFEDVQACITKKGFSISNTISKIIIYDEMRSGKMIYDYSFTDMHLPFEKCQEVLFFPDTKDCAFGMVVPCYFEMPALLT